MRRSVSISKILKATVANVSTKLLPQLSALDANITGVHYSQGHPLEIQKAMQLLSQGGPDAKKMRYPAVWLFRDFIEPKGRKAGIYSEPSIRLFIVTRTDPSYNSDQREEISFNPILYPILLALLDELDNTGLFENYGETMEQFDQIDHYFWGKEGLFSKDSNFFTDWLDCIELQNFKLSILTPKC